ncbi:MAG: hypothetical protein JRI68_31710, partial [Deltaproteobacteria bacterium]|nr:hypothetical protein [Deltaproteobacteria bacterium]
LQDARRLADAAEETALAPFADVDERRAAAMEAMAQSRYRDAKNQLKLLVMHGHNALDILIAQRLAQGHLCRVEGNFDEAAAQFEAALELDPLDKGAREAKAALDEVHQQQDEKSSSLLERLLGK